MNNPNDEAKKDNTLDLSNTGRDVWLVKIPKYIEDKWKKAPGNTEVGKLRIIHSAGKSTRVEMSLSEAVLSSNEPGEASIPKEHHFDLSNVTNQCLGVFSQVEANSSDSEASEPEKLYMEGRIKQKLECRPCEDKNYFNMKFDSIRKASIPQRQVQQLHGIVHNFKPVSDHKHNIEYNQKKKTEQKNYRDDKETVLDMLFKAFEKHQYYNIKDLHKITKQPIAYLKEIVEEICNYNTKRPHKNMWELKPEYRYYKKEPPVEKKEEINSSDSD